MPMFKMIRRIYIFRHPLWDMAFSQLKAKYAGSKLGIWWAIVIPLILAASINFVFTAVLKINIPNYTLFVLAGIIPWFFFTNALLEAANSFIVNASILKQTMLPREFIPLSCVIANLLNFLIGLIFLLPLFIISNFRIIKVLPFLFLIIVLHFVFVVGLGFLFSIINVFFRDLSHFLSIAFMVWFWVTPVFYSLDMLPRSFCWLYFLNPMTYYIIFYQGILFEAKTPSLPAILTVFLISILFFSVGYLTFVRKEPALLKEI